MAKSPPLEPVDDAEDTKRLLVIASIALGCWAALATVSNYSGLFEYHANYRNRPITGVMALLAFVFAGHIVALFIGLRIRSRRRLTELIVAVAVVFRLTILPTVPIQELDIYRYLWDGAVTTTGTSPFRYSPKQVHDANANAPLPKDLAKLVKLRDNHPALAEILSRVHYGDLPTIYPPVSQAVFAMASFMTPPEATLYQRVVILKAWFVALDLATLWILIALLRFTKRHVAWSIAYGWSPLVLKEIANAGHLDAIAVFLTMLAIYLAVRLFWPTTDEEPPSRRYAWMGAVLGLAVGAKLYPIILVPWVAFTAVRRRGWKTAGIMTGTTAAVVLATCWPMLPRSHSPAAQQPPAADTSVLHPPSVIDVSVQDPSRGLSTFLRYWEMNDFLFMIVVENLKPMADVAPQDTAWFSIVPESWRMRLLGPWSRAMQVSSRDAAFMMSRALTGFAFVALALALAWYAAQAKHPTVWLSYGFLTTAWFWLLAPTQNPWYWVWALPLVGFARSRVWLAMGGLVLIYYIRFWFSYQRPDQEVFGTAYRGTTFFDFVITWLEFAPWFLWLAIDWYRSRKPRTEQPVTQPSR